MASLKIYVITENEDPGRKDTSESSDEEYNDPPITPTFSEAELINRALL